MGPRSSDRGNACSDVRAVNQYPQLQWGRDHLIAEMQPQYEEYGELV